MPSLDRGPRSASLEPWRLRSLAGGAIGNLVEWYDWYVYSVFSLYFAAQFFPGQSEIGQLMGAAAIFAAGFLMRPVGGWLMGVYADRCGRKRALTLSVLAMSLGSFAIAVLPTFALIGNAAPVLLLLVRLLQGLSVGGEYGASATYLSEIAPQGLRGFYSSFQYVTLVGGQLLALAVLLALRAILPADALADWGWRVPFLIGGLLALVALWMRRSISETEAFEAGDHNGGVRKLLFNHPRAVAIVVGMTVGGTVAFYTFTTYLQKLMAVSAGWSREDASALSAVTLCVFLLFQPVFGYLSDRIGRLPLLIGFGALGLVSFGPILALLSADPSWESAVALTIAALVVISGYTSINAIVKAELFPSSVRALGVGFPYAVTVSLFGGSAEFLGLWATNAGRPYLYYGYVTACVGVSFFTYVAMAWSGRGDVAGWRTSLG